MWKRLDEGIACSEKLAGLSWQALGAWIYVLAQTDTMGRFPRDNRIIKARCMTLRYDLRLELVEEALLEIERAGLLHRYDVEGKAYLVLHNYQEFNPPGAVGRVSPKYPPPPSGLCSCVDSERRASGVLTPDVTSCLVSSSSSSGEERPSPTSPESRLMAIAEQQRVIAKDDTLRRYATGWISDRGYQYSEQSLMDPWSRGKDILTIHDRFFRVNGKASGHGPAPPLKQKRADPECKGCSGSGKRLNPGTGKQMDCACVR